MLLRFGCAITRHARLVVLVWLLLLAGAVPIAPRVFQALSSGGFSNDNLEAARADALLAKRFGYSPAVLYVVFTDPSGLLAATDPAFQAQEDLALEGVRSLPSVAAVTTSSADPRQVAPDGRAAYAVVALADAPGGNGRDIVSGVHSAIRSTRLEPTLTGAVAFYNDIYDVTEQDLRRAEEISFPFAAIALLFVFGSVIAAAVPAVIGGTAVALTLAILVVLSNFTSLSIYALNLTTMLGLGLGIDYSLFIVSRFREELAKGRAVDSAVAYSIATAGRAVLFSGITVFIGLLGLLPFNFDALRSLGIAGSVVVAVSVLAALTFLPASLALLGGRIDALALGRLFHREGPMPGGEERNGFWTRLASLVMAHPVATLVPVLLLLLGFGSPFLRVQFGAPDASILPPWVPSRHGYDLLRDHWGEGELAPILLAFRTADGSPVLSPGNVGALYDFTARVQADPRVARVESIVTIDSRLSRQQYQMLYAPVDLQLIQDGYARAAALATIRGDTAVVRAVSRYGQTDNGSKSLVRDIRATPPPPGFTLLVGGGTAGVIDYADTLYQEFPRSALIVLAAIYLVLLVTFRSVVIPLKAIIMNVLSLLASYGMLVVIFQDGTLSSLLRFRPLGFVEASLPIVMFCVLFGLSMDYEVFLLARIREAFEATGDNSRSVARGLERSGRIITSAAAIVVLVSLSFVPADIVLIKALGLGTAIAVFLDATIVRALLVPATMRLLGDWNWWAPSWLLRVLPRGRFDVA